MKKQSKKTKTDTSKKRGRPPKKAQKQTTKKQPETQPETEQPEDKTVTEEEQHNHEIMQSQTEQPQTDETILQPESDEKTEPHLEPQSRPPYNIETDLNQSQVQALRSRFSHLTAEHFEGGTAEEVLQRLAETTGTDINELKTIIKAWGQPPQNSI